VHNFTGAEAAKVCIISLEQKYAAMQNVHIITGAEACSQSGHISLMPWSSLRPHLLAMAETVDVAMKHLFFLLINFINFLLIIFK
jgi:hypothetical protein